MATTRLPGVLPFANSVWTAADPASGLPSAPTLWDDDAARTRCNRLWRKRLDDGEVAGFVALTRTTHSTRVHRAGDREVRAILRCEDTPWGLVSLRRRASQEPFTAAELRLLAGLTEPLGRIVRRLVQTGLRRGPEPTVPHGPGLLLFDPRLELVSVGGDVEPWVSTFDDDAHVGTDFDLPLPMWIVTAAAHALTSARARGTGHVTVRAATRRDHWVAAQASATRGADARPDGVAVTIESARPSALAPVIAAAHGISDREREVVRHVIAGTGTSAIAATLGISSHTVRDHVKSVLRKVGVSSRAELTAFLLGIHRRVP